MGDITLHLGVQINRRLKKKKIIYIKNIYIYIYIFVSLIL